MWIRDSRGGGLEDTGNLPGGFHSFCIRAPMKQPGTAEGLKEFKSLACADVPMPTLLDLRNFILCKNMQPNEPGVSLIDLK